VPQILNLPSLQFQPHPQPGTNASWIPNPSPLGLPPSQHPVHPPHVQNSAPVFRGGHRDMGQPNAPPFRRQQQSTRRDQHNTYNQNRNHHSRQHVNRYTPGNNNTGHPHGVPHPPLMRPTQFQTSGDRNQWAAGR
jgi:hypothetical protein